MERILVVDDSEEGRRVAGECLREHQKHQEAVGLLRKEGHLVATREFVKIGLPFTLVATTAGAFVLWLTWS